MLCAIEYEHPKRYFMDAMDAGLANYTDACSLHPYNNGMPESGTMADTLQCYKDQYKGKKDDIEIWNTELGFTSADDFVGNEDTKGIYNCRNGLMYKSRGLGDMFVLYNFEQKGTNDLSREDRFGHVSSGYYPIEGKYFVPMRSYVMIAAYNYIMTNSDAISNHDSTDGNVRVSRFRSHKFDKDV